MSENELEMTRALYGALRTPLVPWYRRLHWWLLSKCN